MNDRTQLLAGSAAPCSWSLPLAKRRTLACALLCLTCTAGCGDEERTETYGPFALAMNEQVAPYYDDGELTLYEVRLPVSLPIAAPTEATLQALPDGEFEPYGRHPWLTSDAIKVQLTWTMTNLDPQDHDVELLIDPWNEFGRYWPGLALIDAEDGEYLPNLSGYDVQFQLPGTERDAGSSIRSRRQGTLTYQDMEELAIDFATVMNLIRNPPSPPAGGLNDVSPQITYANHAFAVENRSFSDALVRPYVPSIIAGLVGFDLGLRTREPANIAVEIAVEVVDEVGDYVLEDSSQQEPFEAPEQYFTVGSGGPG